MSNNPYSPQIHSDELIIQDAKGNIYGFKLSEVCNYNHNTVVVKKHNLYFIWKYGIEHSLTPAWHCSEVSTDWLTIVEAPYYRSIQHNRRNVWVI